MQRSRYFRIDWVLVDQLAIGPAPRAERHLDRLRDAGIKCVLSLCSPDEATPPAGLSAGFHTSRYVLPDHRAGRLPTLAELETALGHLADLQQKQQILASSCLLDIHATRGARDMQLSEVRLYGLDGSALALANASSYRDDGHGGEQINE